MRNPLPTRTVQALFADTACPVMRLNFTDRSKNAETPNQYCTVQIDANGSGGSKFIMFVNIGASSTDYDQWQFSAYATGVTDPDGVASGTSLVHTQCTTLKALIKAVRALCEGVTINRLHAPADMTLDNDDWIDTSKFRLGGLFKEIGYRDVSELLTFAYRIGVPEDVFGKVGAGKLNVVRIVGYANSNSDTDCELKISRDPDDVDEADETELSYTRKIPDAAITTLWDETDGVVCEQGPLLIEVTATTSLAANAYVNFTYQNAEI